MTAGTRRLRNWFGNIASSPAVVVEPGSVDEIVGIMRDPDTYPAPVRAVGSNHSTTPCGVADGGTVVSMRGLDRVLGIGADTVTAQAGALYIDVSRRLRAHGLQFHVNVEIGNLTIGSAACGQTKDASFPGEYGQVCSYACEIKLVTASGEQMTISEDQPELLRAVRSSHGLLGIVYEATFKVRPIEPMVVHHATYDLDTFERRLPALRGRGEALMLYIDPYLDTITVEFRRYEPTSRPGRASSWQWRLRNLMWSTIAPFTASWITRRVASTRIRHVLLEALQRLINVASVRLLRGRHTIASDQMIRYPDKATSSGYTFSIWAFPEDRYAGTLRDYYDFVRTYLRSRGYRPNLTHVGYRISQDTSSTFSYTHSGPVVTIDPVSTGGEGWEDFLLAYNDFCSRHGGMPLLNQTPALRRSQVHKAFGDRIDAFEGVRADLDPKDRLLNDYFAQLLGREGSE